MAAKEQVRHPAPARPPPPRNTGRGRRAVVAQQAVRMEQPNEASSLHLASDIRTFHDMQKFHDLVFHHVNSALAADQRNDTHESLSGYTEGLRLLEVATRVDCGQLTGCSSEQMDKAQDMQMKMNKTKQQIAFRLQELQHSQGPSGVEQPMTDMPPSYDEAMSEPHSMEEDMNSLAETIWGNDREQSVTNGTELYQIPDGVQIFYISPQGFVSAPSYPSSLSVVKIQNDQHTQQCNAPPAFLHVGDWMYPLVPGSSPALHTSYGAYMFPDVMSQQAGATVGLILPDNLPSMERLRFEELIKSFTVMREQTEPPAPATRTAVSEKACETEPEEDTEEDTTTSSRISRGILTAADWMAWGMGKGAEKAGELIRAGSAKLRQRMDRSEKEYIVDPRLKKGVVYARQATHATVKVTGFIVTKLGEATRALGAQVAPYVRREGEKFLPDSLKKDGQGKSTLDGVVEVAASGLKGIGTVYIGLEAAAKTLGRSLTEETVSVVEHRYGSEAGSLTENTMYAAGNCALTAYNANHLGLKAVAKRAAKDTGKAVLDDMNKNKQPNQNGSAQSKSKGGGSYKL